MRSSLTFWVPLLALITHVASFDTTADLPRSPIVDPSTTNQSSDAGIAALLELTIRQRRNYQIGFPTSTNHSSNVTTAPADEAAARQSGTRLMSNDTLADNAMTNLSRAWNDAEYERKLRDLAQMLPDIQWQTDPNAINGSSEAARREALEVLTPSLNESITLLHKRQNGGAVRIMCVGDSLTHGSQGDHTWRYRVWQAFRQQGIPVEFVGPYTGTNEHPPRGPPKLPPLYGASPPQEQPRTNGPYAADVDPAFLENSRHFAVWGRAAAVDKWLIWEQVSYWQPDVLLVMLGFNDLGWFYSDAPGTLASMKTLVDNARAAKPTIQFALANVIQRTFIGGRQDLVDNTNLYNRLLDSALPSWQTPLSAVVPVYVQQAFSCLPASCPAGHDGLHPNWFGEYQIARIFSQALVTMRYLREPIAVPANNYARPLGRIENMQMGAYSGGVFATWNHVLGATGYLVRYRPGAGTLDWTEGRVWTNGWWGTWTLADFVYEAQVAAFYGNNADGNPVNIGPWSPTLAARGAPATAPPPTDPDVVPTANGFRVRFNPAPVPAGIGPVIQWQIIYWDLDTRCQWISGYSTQNTIAFIENLKVGNRYLVAIESWNGVGPGLPIIARTVVPGIINSPPIPGAPSVFAIDPTTAQLRWDPVARAGGYAIYARNPLRPDLYLLGTSDTPCKAEGFLFPGVQTFTFCISSYNGNFGSPVGPCIQGGLPQGGSPPSCPGPQEWCPATGPPCTGGGCSGLSQPPNPTHVYDIVSLGDSYAAGPGAGPRDETSGVSRDCYQTVGAYPAQLNRYSRFLNQPQDWEKGLGRSRACTGDVTNDITRPGGQLQDAPLNNPDIITLSIGGNDLGFSTILRKCVFALGLGTGGCDAAFAAADALLDSGALNRRLIDVWDAIFLQQSMESPLYPKLVYQELYPRYGFFNADTDWCSGQRMSVYIIPGRRLTRELRTRLNALSLKVWNALNNYIEVYNFNKSNQLGDTPWPYPRLIAMNARDGRGHRFCEEGVTDFNDPSIWYFTIGGPDNPPSAAAAEVDAAAALASYDGRTCSNTAQYQNDEGYAWYCDIAATLLRDNIQPVGTMVIPDRIIQAFHPKTSAFTVVTDAHIREISDRHWTPRNSPLTPFEGNRPPP